MNLQSIIIAMNNIGLTDVLLPFILIFAIVFAVLSNINLFGDKKKNINVVIALVLALTVVIPHVTGSYPAGGDVVEIMNKAMPNVSLIIVAVIMLLLLVGVWGIRFTGSEGSSFKGIIAFVSIGIIIYLFGSAAGWFGSSMFTRITANPETVAVVVAILIFGIIIFAITAEPKDPNSKNFLGSMMKDFNDSWKK